VFSQCGEDGVIEWALNCLPIRDKWCADIGAHDGVFESNTRRLILEEEYSAVLVEGVAEKAAELSLNYRENSRVRTFRAIIGCGADDGIDRILKQTDAPIDFDFLSIDIDGCDFHVWTNMREFSPKIICIEFNPTMGDDVYFVQEAKLSIQHGSSVLAMNALAKSKGYEPIAILPFNAIFVRRDFFHRFDPQNDINYLRTDRAYITHLFCGYDGTVFQRGMGRNPWSDKVYATGAAS
jgi:hypothetical protein